MSKRVGGFINQDGLNAPNAPTSVSGTAGDSSVDVSFTAPSDVGGAAITGYSVQADDGSSASPYFSGTTYSSKSLDASSQVSAARDVAFNGDGSKAYVLDGSVYQYSLSTPFDVSTGSYDSVSFNFASQDTSPQGVAFNNDGTKMYMAGNQVDNIYQYSLSTAYNVGTASYDSVSFSISSQDSFAYGVNFNADGTKMYVLGGGTDSVYQYSLSTSFDLSTASYDSVSFSFSSEASLGNGMAFSSTGSSVFIIGTTNTVYQYSLSTAFDLSTASYTNVSFSVGSQDGDATGVTFNNSNTNMYVMGSNNSAVYQYSVPEYPTESPVTVTGLTNDTAYTFRVWALNAFGWSSPSDVSGSVTPAAAIALFAGGYTTGDVKVNSISSVSISSAGNATSFGDLGSTKAQVAAIGSSERAVFAGNDANTNVIEFVTFSTGGNTTDFGDLTQATRNFAGLSNNTRGVFGGGFASDETNVMEYVTIASAGNATDFGDLNTPNERLCALASPTRGVFAGGSDAANVGLNVIEFVTIATTGDATDFGDLANTDAQEIGACASSVRGLFGGQSGTPANTIQYITIASTGNATDFGDLTSPAEKLGAASSETRGLFAGGDSTASGGGEINIISFVTIASTGNATDFGDLEYGWQTNTAGCSNAHGGLS